MTDRGFIKINERMETSVKGIFAIGDVAGPPMLAHKGEREGIVFAEYLAGQPHVHNVNYGNIPNATYCHPEVASIGMTERELKEKKVPYKIGRFPFSANGRARTSGETDGFVKIISDPKYGEILGAHIIGAHATEIIHELAVARENEFTVEEVELAIHAHPTLSEAIAEATLDTLGKNDQFLIMADRELLVLNLGERSYAEVLAFQRDAAARRITGEIDQDLLILVEHPPVVTLGRKKADNKLPVTEDFLRSRGIELFEVERGGGVTFHGPGQLVGYPIFDLQRHKLDLHWYLRQVEEGLIRTLGAYGIPGERSIGFTGVWTDGKKIASIGVHARTWVTWHGFALNVTTDLSYFNLMTPCGIDGVVMTSMSREQPGRPMTLEAVAEEAARQFGELFELTPRVVETV